MIINKISRAKQYFLRGHANWFALAISMVNFTLIFYNFLFVNLDFIPDEFKSFGIFFVLFLILYIPLCIIVGYLDFMRGTYKAENELAWEINPIWKIIREQLDRIESGMNDKT